MRGPGTAFVVVSSPEEEVLEDAEYLSTKMGELRMPLKGVVLNRVHHEFRRAGRRAPGDQNGRAAHAAEGRGAESRAPRVPPRRSRAREARGGDPPRGRRRGGRRGRRRD